MNILEVLENALPSTKKSFGTPTILKLCACLRFFAEGGYQKAVATDYAVNVLHSTITSIRCFRATSV